MVNIKRRNTNENAGINLTPLIDIVFLLLIFFMLTANFITNEGLNIKLPETKSKLSYIKNEPIIIYLTSSNRIYLKGKFYTLSQLQKILPQEIKNNETKTVILKSDKDAKVEMAVKILDIAKISGAKKFVIATKRSNGIY